MAGFLLGAAGMFAVTYSTQAILPQLGRAFGVSPSHAGLTISALIVALAAGAWLWGPLSDRIGRRRSLVFASALLVAPTLAAALELGVRYLGVCCGAGPHHIRSLAEAVGRTPPASRYTADMSKHAYLGSDASLLAENQEFADRL